MAPSSLLAPLVRQATFPHLSLRWCGFAIRAPQVGDLQSPVFTFLRNAYGNERPAPARAKEIGTSVFPESEEGYIHNYPDWSELGVNPEDDLHCAARDYDGEKELVKIEGT